MLNNDLTLWRTVINVSLLTSRLQFGHSVALSLFYHCLIS